MNANSRAMFDAFNYAKKGIRVFPVDVTTGKSLLANTQNDATTDPEIIASWSEKYSDYVFGYIPPKPSIDATPFEYINPNLIPARQWLYNRHLIRRFVSVTIAPGGAGKSSLIIAEAIAMVSGKPLLGIEPEKKLNVWLFNGEDPIDELQRRIMAVAIHYDLTEKDLSGLYVDSGRSKPIVIARYHKNQIMIDTTSVNAIVETIEINKIDVVLVDPFVSTHRVPENDNNAIDLVAKTWGDIAERTNCAIELVHHSRKSSGGDTTIEDGRGASTLINAARSARVINTMKSNEGDSAGVESYRSYFRADNGKSNLAPPSDVANWYHILSTQLPNGDSVGVVTPWEWPNPLDAISVHDLRAAQTAVANNGPWRESIQAKDWVGIPIANALGLDINIKSHKKRISQLLKIWIQNGMFVVVNGFDSKRNRRPFIEVGIWATD